MKSWRFGIFVLFTVSLLDNNAVAQGPGFVSINCGGDGFTDELGIVWQADTQLLFGSTAKVSFANETKQQYVTLRQFPLDERKYCYQLNVTRRTRYLIRATFLYGNFDNESVYPVFDISLGPSHWSSITISEATVPEVRELIFLALDPTVSVCLSNATTGQPFISTLELRQFNGSMYTTEFENQFHLSVSARINFGATSDAPVRYPDDPFDRIWQSDFPKSNYLVDVASGTEKVSTNHSISVSTVNSPELPPQNVMQTAVVGQNGALTYRLNLVGFPGRGWACTYFAEIEDLASHDLRKFRLRVPDNPDLSKPTVNIIENAQGQSYRVYEPFFTNLSLPFVLSFAFNKTADSTLGPILNAMEISSYVPRLLGSADGATIGSFIAQYSTSDWAQEGGDPCLPVPWSWLSCNSDPQPLIVAVRLSNKSLTGNIPVEFTKLSGLQELLLDGNSLSGSIPDFSGCQSLRIIHLENNRLNGKVPSYLAKLPNLKELYIQNNLLSGNLPSGLGDNLVLNYTGNAKLHGIESERNRDIIIGVSVGAAVLLIAMVIGCYLCRKGETPKIKKGDQDRLGHVLPSHKVPSTLGDTGAEAAYCFPFSEIEEATRQFERKIGSGGFGIVYYGKLQDGREIAVKLLTSNSYQGKREFSNEVTLLSRIHHRNLVQFLGYCQEEGKSILVYEFMHNGTLKEHLYGPQERGLNWMKRLEVAEDAGKGIEYLHTGCVPSIIHRDLKTSNILLDKNMRAKVSDFGLSKLAVDGNSHVSSIVRGTVGYLDPEYYISQQLTDKSDVYSFGVILLELISGQEAISNENFGANCRNIVQWAKMHIENGDLQGIIDPTLGDDYDMQSMWKIAEKALMCVQPHGHMRPGMSEVLKEIQDAIFIEKEAEAARLGNSGASRVSLHSSLNMGSLDLGPNDSYLSFDESITRPTAR